LPNKKYNSKPNIEPIAIPCKGFINHDDLINSLKFPGFIEQLSSIFSIKIFNDKDKKVYSINRYNDT